MHREQFGIVQFRRLLPAGTLTVLVGFLIGFADSVIAGNLLGEEALAGVNLMLPVLALVSFFAGLIGVGMAVNYSLESGRLNRRRAHEFFTQGLWLALGGGVLMFALLVLVRDLYLGFLAPGPTVAALAADYWKWFLPVTVLQPLAMLLVNVCYTDGDMRRCLVAYGVQFAVNVAVSTGAVKCGMGLGGCSLGTAVSEVFALAILSGHFRTAGNSFRLVRHFVWRDAWTIMKTSFGDSSSYFFSAALFFVLNKYVIVRFGAGHLPIAGVVILVLGTLELLNGISTALSPIITVYIGERNVRAVRSLMRHALKWSLGEGLGLMALLAVFPGLMVGAVGIDDPVLVPLAENAVRAVSVSCVFFAVATLFNSYYLYISQCAISVLVTAVCGFLFPAGALFLFGGFGPMAPWWALGFSPAAGLLACALFLVLKFGRRRFPLLLDMDRARNIRMFGLELKEEAIVEVSRRIGRVPGVPMRAALMAEEVLMAVLDRAKGDGRRHLAEVTLDLNDGVQLTLRDDGEIFDITDCDAQVLSLRSFLVASVMETQKAKVNLVTTGFNRNVFRFGSETCESLR